VPAAPATVGAYLASLAGSHAPTKIRRRLSALGKMHRFNDLPWNPALRDIQGPLQGVLRSHGRPVPKAAALTLPLLRQILATCDTSARGRRDRALLLFGFVGALRRSELVALRVEDVAIVAGGLRLRIPAAQQDTTAEEVSGLRPCSPGSHPGIDHVLRRLPAWLRANEHLFPERLDWRGEIGRDQPGRHRHPGLDCQRQEPRHDLNDLIPVRYEEIS
jgi:integrase